MEEGQGLVLCSLPSFPCLFGYYLQGMLQSPNFSPASPFHSASFCFDSLSASRLNFPRSHLIAQGFLSRKPQTYKLVNHSGTGCPWVRSPPCSNQLRLRGLQLRIRSYLGSRSRQRSFLGEEPGGGQPTSHTSSPGILKLNEVKSTSVGVGSFTRQHHSPDPVPGHTGPHRLKEQ